MKPTDERITEFNGRINTWISKQGLVFQLTHGGTGLGGRAPVIGSLIRATLSCFLIAALSLLGYGGFLVWKATGKELPMEIAKGLAEGLKVESVTAIGFERSGSAGSFREIVAEGDEDSFFNALHCYKVSVPMKLTDGLFSTWDAETITIKALTADLKAGALDDKLSAEIWSSLFSERPSFRFNRLEISNASLSWGYASAATWGQIKESKVIANRSGPDWELVLTGGTFSQGFLRDFEIKTMTAILSPDKGLKIKNAECTTPGGGSFDWSAKLEKGGASPVISCEGSLANIPLGAFLPRGLLPLVGGSISATLTGQGSTNDAQGISYQLAAQPSSSTPIYLTNNIPLLRILDQIDPENSYRKLTFNAGSLRIESQGDGLAFSEIALLSRNTENSTLQAKLSGAFQGRPSTPEDLIDDSLLLQELSETTPAATVGASPDVDLNFASEVLRIFSDLQFTSPQTHHLLLNVDEKGEKLSRARLKEEPRRHFRPPFVLEGELQLSIPQSAFGEYRSLPGVSFPTEFAEDGDTFANIAVPLRNFTKSSTRKLANDWEETIAN